MKSVKLLSGKTMPIMSVGMFQVQKADVYNTLDAALNAGYRAIDTASGYGNEWAIAEALRQLLPKHNLTRKDIFITSKIGPDGHRIGKCLEICDRSLKNLSSDYIDLYLIHWPGTVGLKHDDEANIAHRKNTWKILEGYHKKGKFRSIGVSNYTMRHMQELLAYCEVKPSVLQIEHHPHLVQSELVDFCRQHGILFQAYSSLGTSATEKKLLTDPTVCELADKYGKSLAQILLRWAVQDDIGVIPKSTNPDHIAENIDIFDFEIKDEDMQKLNSLHQNHHYCWNPETIA